jgi:hypothetical protein
MAEVQCTGFSHFAWSGKRKVVLRSYRDSIRNLPIKHRIDEGVGGVLLPACASMKTISWVATADGRMQAYPLDGELPLALTNKPDLEWKVDGATLLYHVDLRASRFVNVATSRKQSSFRLGKMVVPWPLYHRLVGFRSSNVHSIAHCVSHSRTASTGRIRLPWGETVRSQSLENVDVSGHGRLYQSHSIMSPRHGC